MFREHEGPREGFATETAFERLLSSVVSHVVSVEMIIIINIIVIIIISSVVSHVVSVEIALVKISFLVNHHHLKVSFRSKDLKQ